jgi:high-affinity iron transporter
MAGAFLILLREGFEAALIIGIILAVLARLGEMRHVPYVFWGVACAALGSVVFALFANGVSDLFGGAGQELLNCAILAVAAVMITYVMVWMKESRKHIEEQLKGEVNQRVSGHGMGVFTLAFLSVFREGAESVLFLWGVILGGGESAARVITGGLLGLATAVAICWMLFQGGRRIPLRQFFTATTWMLVLLAAGMLGHAAGLLVAVDWLPALVYQVWDTSAVLPDHRGVGSVLAILIGYNANPTLTEVLVWGAYLGGVGAWIVLSERPAAPRTA